jgi:hypothetical protein
MGVNLGFCITNHGSKAVDLVYPHEGLYGGISHGSSLRNRMSQRLPKTCIPVDHPVRLVDEMLETLKATKNSLAHPVTRLGRPFLGYLLGLCPKANRISSGDIAGTELR